MKKITYYLTLKIAMLFLFGFINTFVFAQDSTTTSHTVTTTRERTVTVNNWYMQPWVWVVGGAVFIIILVALFRSGTGKKVEVTRTTVIKPDNYS